jgi:hypothetical protein
MRQDTEHETERVAVTAPVVGVRKRRLRELKLRSVIAGAQFPASTAGLVRGPCPQGKSHVDCR